MYDDYKTKPLHIMFPGTGAYVKDYDEKTNRIYFATKDNTILDKFSADAKIEVNDRPLYKETFLNTKTTFYGDEATNFHDKEGPNVDSSYTFLAVMSLNSTRGVYEKYYPQVFLKECKCFEREVIRYITADLENFLMILMKSRLKLRIRMFFGGAVLKVYILREIF